MSMIITPRQKDLTSMMLFPTQQEGAGEEAETDREKEERKRDRKRVNDMQIRVSENKRIKTGAQQSTALKISFSTLQIQKKEK